MRLHRFYIPPHTIELTHEFWVHDEVLRKQWLKVFRYREGAKVVLFDGERSERLYRIVQIEPDGVKLQLVTEFERILPDKHVYLFFSLLKKDKNEWVLQKCTELGVRNFVPVIAERSEKTGFNMERAEKIIIEAAEQCGRSDIPQVREPLQLDTVLAEYRDKVRLFAADETHAPTVPELDPQESIGIFIGPEGGWTEQELSQFKSTGVEGLYLGQMTLRAETAAVTAVSRFL